MRCDVPRRLQARRARRAWNHRSTRCGVPLGFPVRASDRVARDRLNPFRLNRRHSPSPKAIGFNDFSGDYPFATRPTDCRPGNNLKSSSPSTLIFDSCPPIALRPAFVSTTDVRQQTRQHSLMHPIGVADISARPNTDLSGNLPKLTVEIAPFAHSQPVEILITTLAGMRCPTMFSVALSRNPRAQQCS